MALFVALVLALGGCAADPATQPSQTTTQPPATQEQGSPLPAPSATASKAPWTSAPIHAGLITVAGTTLLAPAETVEQGEVTGWFAALEVASGTPTQIVADSLATQLTHIGATVSTTTLSDGTVALAGQSETDGVLTRYDVQVTGATATEIGIVTLMAASEKVAQ